MAKWTDIGPQCDFPPGTQKSLRVDGVPVVLFGMEGCHRALINVCPHAGLPLGEGELRGKVITCPFHGYAYNVETGKNIDFPDVEPPVRTLPVRTSETGVLQIDLQPDKA